MRVSRIPGTVLGLFLTLLALSSPAAATAFTLSKVADLNTPIPGGTGNFTTFQGLDLSGTNAVFQGEGSSGQKGIYFFKRHHAQPGRGQEHGDPGWHW